MRVAVTTVAASAGASVWACPGNGSAMVEQTSKGIQRKESFMRQVQDTVRGAILAILETGL
ncbi:hypothetical protein GCM10007320_36130 [Pseudorhodoferax aquiterrae]|uniref:Uncharacterized protein n=1 Tax=Pseudorhodoferax aquiterrae TaxID=747304 RepID=A0ABQ3G4D9_9BURK|nr:hypothetical protein GCM10007320_36130 [Pseudorhodoferax aquiterrae]